jgi:tetratricopeptide (TPR) repeat protein
LTGSPANYLTTLTLAVYRDISFTQSARHFQDASVLETRGDIMNSVEALRKCILTEPSNIQALLKLAKHSAAELAENLYVKVLKFEPGHIEASLLLSELLCAKFQFRLAADSINDALAKNGSSIELQWALANIYMKQSDFGSAESQLRVCLELQPSHMGSFQLLLDILERLDRLSDAEQLCNIFLGCNPPYTYIFVSLASIFTRQLKWEQAENLYLQLLSADPGSLTIRLSYADMLQKSGRNAEALAVHEMNIKMAPGNPEGYLRLVDIQHTLGDIVAATTTLGQVRKMYSQQGGWGQHSIPNPLSSRIIFNQLENIASRYCTGSHALIDKTGLDLKTSHQPGAVVELFCMVFGHEHIEFLEHLAYPALLATAGFDDLLRERKVVYNIYTTPQDMTELQSFLGKLDAQGIGYRVNLEVLSLSQDYYSILCLPIIDQLNRSLALRSIVVSTMPDLIISGSLARVINDMKVGETVVCAMPRIDSCIAFPALRAELEKGPLQSRDFVRRSMTDFLHPQTYSAMKNSNKFLTYHDTGSYYEARNFAPPPLCFYARPEMLDSIFRHPMCGPNSNASFYTIDHDFVESAYRGGNLRLIPDSDYFFWAELTHPQRHLDFLSGRKYEDYYYPSASEFIFSNEFKWIYAD